MQKLEVFQSLWAMEQRHPRMPEPGNDEKFARVAAAGYAGMCLDPAVDEIDDCLALRPLYKEYGLQCMMNVFPASPEDMAPLLNLAKDMDAVLVNVISGVMPIRPEEAVATVRLWMKQAEDAAIPLLFETHRDGLLNDLYFTLQLIELVPEMRLCADLSHFVVDRELRIPVPERDAGYFAKIIKRSDCFQGRVANREQVQVQIDFPQHRQWVELFQQWWREGMHAWRQRNDDDATLIFLCELGPPPYAMTDGNQDELSDRWREALKIWEMAQAIWQDLEGAATKRESRQ